MATPVRVTAGIVAGRSMAVDMAAAIPLALGPFELSQAAILLGLATGFGIPIAAALMPLWLGTRIGIREALAAWGVASVEPEGTGMLARLLAGRVGRVSSHRTAPPGTAKHSPVGDFAGPPDGDYVFAPRASFSQVADRFGTLAEGFLPVNTGFFFPRLDQLLHRLEVFN